MQGDIAFTLEVEEHDCGVSRWIVFTGRDLALKRNQDCNVRRGEAKQWESVAVSICCSCRYPSPQ